MPPDLAQLLLLKAKCNATYILAIPETYKTDSCILSGLYLTLSFFSTTSSSIATFWLVPYGYFSFYIYKQSLYFPNPTDSSSLLTLVDIFVASHIAN